jgi:lipoprotein-releasing system permease protein
LEKSLGKVLKALVSPWIAFVAFRYIWRKGSRFSASSVLPVLGIAVGVLALTVIIAVMNGFQLGFIETILEVSSYHIRIDGFPADKRNALPLIREINGVSAAAPFREVKGIIRKGGAGISGTQTLAALRALPSDALSLDAGMAANIDIERGVFDIDAADLILLGSEASARISARIGDKIEFISIAGDAGDAEMFTVAGIFRTGFYEYDASWGFINIDAAAKYTNPSVFSVGIKLKNRWKPDAPINAINAVLAEAGISAAEDLRVSTWRDYNKAFFGALRTEKLMMFILVGLIFIVVALNIFQVQRRIVLEKKDEIGLLRSVGASGFDVRRVFAFNGVILGLTGASAGMIPALLITAHIKQFFTLIENVVNSVLSVINAVTGGGDEAFSIFSPAVFYIKEIPSRIIPYEAALIFLFGFLSASAAAWAASKKVSGVKPAEALRYE